MLGRDVHLCESAEGRELYSFPGRDVFADAALALGLLDEEAEPAGDCFETALARPPGG
jgi:hypothetical protein